MCVYVCVCVCSNFTASFKNKTMKQSRFKAA